MSASSKLRFVTWNILAPCYNRTQGSLEKNYPLRYVPRLSSIFATLQQMQADVICLQEFWFRQEIVSLAAQQLPQYRAIFHRRSGGKEDGLAVYVRDGIEILDTRFLTFHGACASLLGVRSQLSQIPANASLSCCDLHATSISSLLQLTSHIRIPHTMR
jgi:exonuclease III